MVEEITLLEEIRRNWTKKQEVYKKLRKDKEQAWKDNKIVYMDGKIYVPNNRNIYEQILQENHNPVNVGYPEQQRVLKLIKRNY